MYTSWPAGCPATATCETRCSSRCSVLCDALVRSASSTTGTSPTITAIKPRSALWATAGSRGSGITCAVGCRTTGRCIPRTATERWTRGPPDRTSPCGIIAALCPQRRVVNVERPERAGPRQRTGVEGERRWHRRPKADNPATRKAIHHSRTGRWTNDVSSELLLTVHSAR